MKNFFDKTRSFLSTLGSKLKRESKSTSAVNEPPTAPRTSPKGKTDRFTIVSWIVTLVIVVSLLGATVVYKNANASNTTFQPQVTPGPGGEQPLVGAPMIGSEGSVSIPLGNNGLEF